MKPLYRAINSDPIEEMERCGSVTFPAPTSFASEIDANHRDFGSYLIVVDWGKICNRCDCFEVKYSFDWLTFYPSLLYKITTKDAEDWIDWARGEFYIMHDLDEEPTDEEIDDIITQEIKDLYGWENEVIVGGGEGESVVIYPDDVLWMGELGEQPYFSSRGVRRSVGKPGWFDESYRHALAARGIRTR